uniref:DUF642 domain-containing protein n=1 Tax=Zea mays TaxID=4577 RepID=B4FE07_MAIZE|nr:unknown [Zea mays]
MRRVALLLVAAVCALAAPAAAVVTDGLLPNGNFEDGPPKSALVNGTVVSGAHAIPRWETSGFVEYIESGHKQGDMLLVVPQGARRLLRHHVQRGADVRAGGAAAAERVGEPRVGRAADADHLRQQRLGLVRLGIQGKDGRGDAGHPQPGRGGGPGLRPAHRRRRHPCAVPARARQAGGGKQPAQERRVRGGPLLPARRVLGRARPAQHRGRPLAAPRLDDRLVQGRQVRGRRALRRAPGRARRRAGGRPGERARAGGPHRAWVDLPPRLRRGRLGRRLRGLHGRRGLRGARHGQGALPVQGHRRIQARRAGLHGHRQPHPRRLPEHLLPHEARRHALRPARRRRLARRPAQEEARAPPHAAPVSAASTCTTPGRTAQAMV